MGDYLDSYEKSIEFDVSLVCENLEQSIFTLEAHTEYDMRNLVLEKILPKFEHYATTQEYPFTTGYAFGKGCETHAGFKSFGFALQFENGRYRRHSFIAQCRLDADTETNKVTFSLVQLLNPLEVADKKQILVGSLLKSDDLLALLVALEVV